MHKFRREHCDVNVSRGERHTHCRCLTVRAIWRTKARTCGHCELNVSAIMVLGDAPFFIIRSHLVEHFLFSTAVFIFFCVRCFNDEESRLWWKVF